MLERADSNNDGKISFEDFYSVMVKSYYWLNLQFHWIIFFNYLESINVYIMVKFKKWILIVESLHKERYFINLIIIYLISLKIIVFVV